jgi:hypothetical protein
MEHIQVSNSVDRVLHVPLTESEWQAFLASTPQPIDWLRERIKEAIAKGAPGAPSRES